MKDKDDRPQGAHYHIHWSDGKVDWERHATRADAERSARQLIRSDETYIIEKFAGPCEVCKSGPYGRAAAQGR